MNTQLSAVSDQKNMRHMREHEAFPVWYGMNLFCGGLGFTKQILEGVFGDFCLILPHKPHVFALTPTLSQWARGKIVKNMRDMREHEDRVFKGFYLFRIGMGVRLPALPEKYEAASRTSSCFASCFDPLRLCRIPPNADDPRIWGKEYG